MVFSVVWAHGQPNYNKTIDIIRLLWNAGNAAADRSCAAGKNQLYATALGTNATAA